MAATALSAAFILAAPLIAQVPSFPGAYGFGSSATGGRGGTVYHVTNLNDSGPGSFRDAVSQANRIVVFDVGGYIQLHSPVSVSSNITIAGQTAPGGGIGVMGAEVSLSNKTNIIVRDVRFRQGTLDPQRGKSALGMSLASDIILDHCSFEFGQWDSIDAVKTSNFTVQNSIIADPIYQRFGAHVERGPSTFYRNLWVNVHNRQPLAKDNTQYINNIIYDFQLGYTVGNTGGYFDHDIVNNYFIAGPATSNPNDAYFQMNSRQSVYAVGNFLDAAKDGSLNGDADNNVGAVVYLNAPWDAATNDIPTISAQAAFPSVVESAGSFPRDPLDSLVAQQVDSLGTQGQLYESQTQTGLPNGGYGVIASGEPFADTSGDGIANYWAVANGLSTTDPSVGSAMWGKSGYTNLEVYVNSLVLPSPWTATSLAGPNVQAASSYNPFTGKWLLIGTGQKASSTTSGQVEFASQIMQGDGAILAQVESPKEVADSGADEGLGPQGSAGVMLRQSTAPDAAFVFASVRANHQIAIEWRSTDGDAIQRIFVPGSPRIKSAIWLKVTRTGNTFTALFSIDGHQWTPIAAVNAAMSTNALAGLALTSVDPNKQTLATFSGVEMDGN